ncbi:schlafen family protein [Burkholderia sp. 140710038-1]|uniref:AlbA family DNA-binding domain-containing protein n=1 Tax=Burkholderia contaminans TaxID=488447 RepID=UPI0015FD93B5|nr:ATP-binding protein [Burkholderia contaminans]MBA9930739.1 ATP-binding protein [Burkholderia contaminans]MBX3824044.1 ATP-binding protein [Burkholderia contaminans]
MNREYTSGTLPDKLVEYFSNVGETDRFRRRAVLTYTDGNWRLLCCTVELLRCDAGTPSDVSTRRYECAMLYEDELSASQCLEFARELTNGFLQLDDVRLTPEAPLQWSTELVPLNNDYMPNAGLIVGLRISSNGMHAHAAPLLSPTQPYYPDIEDAARDWLPFPIYHGRGDGRNDQLLFLLPEKRAFVSDARFCDDRTLEITVAGTAVDEIALIVKGAYWEGTAIRHFDASINGSICWVAVPDHIDRLEYYLIALDGTVFDFHREARLSSIALGKKILGPKQRSLGEQIGMALHDGEGQRVEFKPFVEPGQSLGTGANKTKLREIVTTVVAFANTHGGHIYIGVDDDCIPAGIEQQLERWAKAPADEVNVDRYLGMLKSKIKGFIQGEVELHLSRTYFNDALIVIVEVLSAAQKPVAVQHDAYLYARAGASNRKVPPELWRSILDMQSSDAVWPLLSR